MPARKNLEHRKAVALAAQEAPRGPELILGEEGITLDLRDKPAGSEKTRTAFAILRPLVYVSNGVPSQHPLRRLVFQGRDRRAKSRPGVDIVPADRAIKIAEEAVLPTDELEAVTIEAARGLAPDRYLYLGRLGVYDAPLALPGTKHIGYDFDTLSDNYLRRRDQREAFKALGHDLPRDLSRYIAVDTADNSAVIGEKLSALSAYDLSGEYLRMGPAEVVDIPFGSQSMAAPTQ